ncbi:MAG: hypothetical protein M1826_006505 [Phylliscum demangeonii]|nr:MAG: hypothetical protein M1826_006505 [Phylliscum demangeonii]
MASGESRGAGKIYVVEHLDAEMGPWSTLEYRCIAEEAHRAGARCYLMAVPESVELPDELKELPSLEVFEETAEKFFEEKEKICLLDPGAKEELSPRDGQMFNVFLFGGILVPLDRIAYIDNPELKIADQEHVDMPFRYVKGADGEPVMPKGMMDLIKDDSEKGIGDLI